MGKKLNVLIYLHSREIAGETKHVIGLAKNLDRNHFSLDIACPKGPVAEYLLNEAMDLKDVVVYSVPMRGHHDLKSLIYLTKLILKRKYHIVHVHQVTSGVIGRVAGKLGICKVVVTESSITPEHYWIKSKMKLWVHLHILHPIWNSLFVDRLIAISEAVKKSVILREGINPHKVSVIPYGVDFKKSDIKEKKVSLVREKYRIKKDKCLIGTAARLVDTKGIDVLIRAFSILCQLNSQIRLLIIGDGPLKYELINEVKRLHLEDVVIFSGWRRDAVSYIQALDIFVLPSIYEPLGLVILEAMASGIPVIGSNVDAIPEIIENDITGMLVPPGDEKKLADAISRMTADRQMARKMARNAIAKIEEKFSLKHTTMKIEKIYSDLFANKIL